MFTGLIQAVGKIHSQSNNIFVEGMNLPFSINVGDSIAVDGVCLTASAIRDNGFLADISEETLYRSTLGHKAENNGLVNLEPAIRLSDRLGGHLVSGHVDGLGQVISLVEKPNSWLLEIGWSNADFAKYICEKASIALNGISLTISECKEEGAIFSIAVIPHTWSNTGLKYLTVGEMINLEADLMAKYAEKLLLTGNILLPNKQSKQKTDISIDWLSSQGWS